MKKYRATGCTILIHNLKYLFSVLKNVKGANVNIKSLIEDCTQMYHHWAVEMYKIFHFINNFEKNIYLFASQFDTGRIKEVTSSTVELTLTLDESIQWAKQMT